MALHHNPPGSALLMAVHHCLPISSPSSVLTLPECQPDPKTHLSQWSVCLSGCHEWADLCGICLLAVVARRVEVFVASSCWLSAKPICYANLLHSLFANCSVLGSRCSVFYVGFGKKVPSRSLFLPMCTFRTYRRETSQFPAFIWSACKYITPVFLLFCDTL